MMKISSLMTLIQDQKSKPNPCSPVSTLAAVQSPTNPWFKRLKQTHLQTSRLEASKWLSRILSRILSKKLDNNKKSNSNLPRPVRNKLSRH